MSHLCLSSGDWRRCRERATSKSLRRTPDRRLPGASAPPHGVASPALANAGSGHSAPGVKAAIAHSNCCTRERTSLMRRLVSLVGFGVFLFLAPLHAGAADLGKLIPQLRQGGYVLVIRHVA